MSGLMDLLSQTFGLDTTAQIGRAVGAEPAGTSSAIATALPALVAALGRNAGQPAGATALHGALTKDHDGSILQNLAGFLGNAQGGPGAGILKHVLGDRRDTVEQSVGHASGLDKRQVAALLVTLAPIVLGVLGRAQRQRKLDASGLASMLGTEHAQHT